MAQQAQIRVSGANGDGVLQVSEPTEIVDPFYWCESPGPSRQSVLRWKQFQSSCHIEDIEVTWEMLVNTPTPPPGEFGGPSGPDCAGVAADRYFAINCVYVGNGNTQRLGPSGHAAWARVSASFDAAAEVMLAGMVNYVPDAVIPRYPNPANPNEPKTDYARELVRQSIAAYSRFGGICVAEVVGDATVTIRGWPLGTGELGNGDYPVNSGASLRLNADLLPPNVPNVAGKTIRRWSDEFRALRNTIVHEFGHNIGFRHAAPTQRTRMMESPVPMQFDGLSIYERRALGRTYGDRFSITANTSSTDAVNLGQVGTPARSVLERGLAINCSPINTTAPEDWFTFTIGESRPIVIQANPTGSAYWHAPIVPSADDTARYCRAAQAGNLRLTLFNAQLGIEADVTSGAAGETKTIDLSAEPLQAGTYYVRVSGLDLCGAWPTDNELVQTYDLSIRVADARVPPRAVAGLRSRIAHVNEPAYFLGHMNSRALEPGADIVLYEWDLDGNGVPDSAGTTAGLAMHKYASAGQVKVSLWVTDTFGSRSKDEIMVCVVDAGATTCPDLSDCQVCDTCAFPINP